MNHVSITTCSRVTYPARGKVVARRGFTKHHQKFTWNTRTVLLELVQLFQKIGKYYLSCFIGPYRISM